MPEPDDLVFTSVCEISKAVSSKKLSPVDLLDAFLRQIDRYDSSMHAFTAIYENEARLAAEAADKAIKAGQSVGPLQGIPIVLKDLVEISNKNVTGGCSLWHNRQSTCTATIARNLIEQGVIILGKTHLVEFAFGGWGTNTRMGTPRNPWDMDTARTPGGSSSGSGVAVASGMAPWAVGSDTGGSIRLPSSWCGLTGLKPTHGQISTHGTLPLSPTLDTLGPMAHAARDAAILYEVMRGIRPSNNWLRESICSAGGHQERNFKLTGRRLAQLPESERAAVSTSVLNAYDRSLDELSRLGAEIVSVELPCSFADIASSNGLIMAAESYALLADIVDDETQCLDEDVRPRVLKGKSISARAYLSALHRRNQLTHEIDHSLRKVDALLTPTTTSTALPLSSVDQQKAPSIFTRFANFFDLCALSIPNGFDDQGLPTSLQINGHRNEESTILQIGTIYQDNTDWHLKRPACFSPPSLT